VRELSSPRVDQSARCPVRELAVRELAYPRVVQLPREVGGMKTWREVVEKDCQTQRLNNHYAVDHGGGN